jgi:predicted GNAT family N-acyltransferase
MAATPFSSESFEAVRSPAGFEEALAVRYEVFCDEQGIPRELERDPEDDLALHVVVRDTSGRVAATGRVLRQSGDGRLAALSAPASAGDRARVGRMAVRAAARRGGLGRAVIERLEAEARRAGLAQAVLHAQLSAAPFYERCGYRREGPIFDEVDIPHVEMRKDL